MVDGSALKVRVGAAQDKLETAEKKLELALASLERLPRAEKTLVSEALRQAFDGVTDARHELSEAESMLGELDGR
jgi:hypothetical protein